MKTADAIPQAEQLSVSRQSALVKLLADDDPSVYKAVREKIISYGPPAVEWLRPHTLSREPVLRRRAQELVLHFGRRTADNEFLSFCLKQGEELDMEHGAWLLAQTQYPDINVEAYQALLDSFAGELRERLDTGANARKVLEPINQYLFQELGFHGNEQAYYDPDNSYLNRVVDRRMGNPIALCLLYLLLSRRLRLPVAGIGLPGHFLCRYQSASDELYIDAFNRGTFLTKSDCLQYLARGNHNIREHCLGPASPRQMLFRMCSNLHQIYQQLELPEETNRLQRYLVALGRRDAPSAKRHSG